MDNGKTPAIKSYAVSVFDTHPSNPPSSSAPPVVQPNIQDLQAVCHSTTPDRQPQIRRPRFGAAAKAQKPPQARAKKVLVRIFSQPKVYWNMLDTSRGVRARKRRRRARTPKKLYFFP